MTALAALCGALVAGGMWLAVSAIRPVPVRPGPSRPAWRIRLAALDTARLAVAAAVGLLALVLTRWPVAAIGAAIGGWFAGGALRRPGRERTEARTEAIALWTEMLRDSMGTARGVEGVLVATAGAAPVAIRPEVQRMAARLPHEPLADVLDDLAADLDHPLGDLVVTALRLTATTGGRRVREVLSTSRRPPTAKRSPCVGSRWHGNVREPPSSTRRWSSPGSSPCSWSSRAPISSPTDRHWASSSLP